MQLYASNSDPHSISIRDHGNFADNFWGNRSRVSTLKAGYSSPYIYTIHFTCWDSFIFLLVGSEELFTAKSLQAKINVRPKPHDGDNQEFLLFYGAQKLCSNMPRRDAIIGLDIYQLSN